MKLVAVSQRGKMRDSSTSTPYAAPAAPLAHSCGNCRGSTRRWGMGSTSSCDPWSTSTTRRTMPLHEWSPESRGAR
jgi:hypothetical protein